MSEIKYKFNLGWNLNEKDELRKALWALSQYRQLYTFIKQKHNLTTFAECVPDMGTDEVGSSSSFDFYMILEFESRKLLEKHNIKFEQRGERED